MRLTRELPSAMAAAMQQELDRNAHKAGWDRMLPGELLRRLKQEMGELDRAVKRGADAAVVWSVAADVSNFAAMLADVYEDEHRAS